MSSSPPVVERLFPFLFLSTEWLISSNKIVPTANAQCGGGKSKRKTITIELSFVRLASIANVRGNWRVHFERERATRVISFFFLVARHQLVKEKEEMMMKVNGCPPCVYSILRFFFWSCGKEKCFEAQWNKTNIYTHTKYKHFPAGSYSGFPFYNRQQEMKRETGGGREVFDQIKRSSLSFSTSPRFFVWVGWLGNRSIGYCRSIDS